MKKSCRLWLILWLSLPLSASERDVPFDWGAAGLYQALQRLQTTASVLHVVAHPDDEDGPLLAYAARGLGARTMLFAITRGEGGANLISGDFFDELGALRTLEHLKAASYYGNELFYSHATDYGYSKNLDEANRAWQNGKPVLADLVEVVRRERPTILCSRFRGTSHDGHGHHQMAGVISRQVFQAAADAQQFPAQLERGLSTWQIRKLYTNNIHPEWRAEDAGTWSIAIPTGQHNALLGMSYAQIARYGLGFQRSQGMSGHLSPAGPRSSYYRLLQTAKGVSYVGTETESSLFDGLDTSLSALAEQVDDASAALRVQLQQIGGHAQQALDSFSLTDTASVIDPLAKGLQATSDALSHIERHALSSADTAFLRQALARKRDEFQTALELALAIDLEVWTTLPAERTAEGVTDFRHATPGQELLTNVRFVHQAPLTVMIRQLSAIVPDGWQVEMPRSIGASSGANEVQEWQLRTRLDDHVEPTRQAWRRASIAEPFYQTAEDFQQRPLPQSPMRIVLSIEVAGVRLTLDGVAEVRFRHPEYGDVRYPLTVVPPVSVRFSSRRGIVPRENTTYPLEALVRSDRPTLTEGQVRLDLPAGWTSRPASIAFSLAKEGDERVVQFTLAPPEEDVPGDDALPVRAIVTYDGREYAEGFRTISAPDLGRVNLYRDAVHTMRRVEVRVKPSRRVAYVMGSGDEVPASLGMLGLQTTLLGAQDLERADLSQWEVILVGVRAYAVREDIRKFNGRLLDYVHKGGVLIVQYQTPEFDHNFGPYPYQMGRNPEEVSEEDATVTILRPSHPLFTTPNTITSADFQHWVEQRGSKFWTTWDQHYTPLLECHDTDQSPQTGGMLIAQYGRGYYVYSAYAWYRQLPEGVPGAFRVVANLLSLPEQVR